MLAERVVSLGRRDATQRLAHVLCEIVARLQLIEKHQGDTLLLPLLHGLRRFERAWLLRR